MKTYRCTETVSKYFDRGDYYPQLAPGEGDELIEGHILIEDNNLDRHSVSPEFLQNNFVEVPETVARLEENWRKGRAVRVCVAVFVTVALIVWWALTWRS